MPSNRSMSVSSERDMMHNGGTGNMGARGCATTWGSRALALMVGVACVLVLAMLATGTSSSNSNKSSKPSFTDMGAGPISMNDKGTIDTNDDAILPAGQMLNDDRPYITLFGTFVIPITFRPTVRSNPLCQVITVTCLW